MVRKARIHIPVEGILSPYTDGHWVVFDKDKDPVGFMLVERRHIRGNAHKGYQADPEQAFKDFWSYDEKGPLQRALEGYFIELVGEVAWNHLMDVHLGIVTRPVEDVHLPDPGEEAA